jgi:hypothetical protein
MLEVLVVGGLLLVIGSRVIGVRVIGARSPRYRDSVVILTAIAQHSLLAFVFAWVGLRVAADDPLRLAIAVSLFIHQRVPSTPSRGRRLRSRDGTLARLGGQLNYG